LAGTIVMLQGLAEILRCLVCLRRGSWPARMKDAEEMDVVEQQLASSTYIDEAVRSEVIEKAHEIDEAARQRSSTSGGSI
jgi:hypothetical protein